MKIIPERANTRWAQLAVLSLLCAIGGLGARYWILLVEEQPVVGGPLRFYAQGSSLGRVAQPGDETALAVYMFAWNVTNKPIVIKGERSSPTYGLRQYLADGECLASTTSFIPNHKPVSQSWAELRPDEVLAVCLPLSDTTVAFELGLLYRDPNQSPDSEPKWIFSERFHLIEHRGLTIATSTVPRDPGIDESAEPGQKDP